MLEQVDATTTIPRLIDKSGRWPTRDGSTDRGHVLSGLVRRAPRRQATGPAARGGDPSMR